MVSRFVSIWFRYLEADHLLIREPELKDKVFVLAGPDRGRMVIREVNDKAEAQGIFPGTVVADAKAVMPSLLISDQEPGQVLEILNELAEWCIRYTPVVAVDPPDGLILDATGCAHLWGGEHAYLKDIGQKLKAKGYHIRAAIAGTVGVAWAVARYGQVTPLIASGEEAYAIAPLPPAALRLEPPVLEKMQKVGFSRISHFLGIPASVLRRRFGQPCVTRLRQALGNAYEHIEPVRPVEPYQERLPCVEPVRTRTAIEIALKTLLEMLCIRLARENNGLRKAIFQAYRMDGKIEEVSIGTYAPSCNVNHLFRLLSLKISNIRPALGIELFVLTAPQVEEAGRQQEALWSYTGDNDLTEIAELLDRLNERAGNNIVKRYLADEHYWPERAYKPVASLTEKPVTTWPVTRPRPIRLLPVPKQIQVSAPIPDYPPMLFRYKEKVYKIVKADGPERIEQEWWLQHGLHRDYYIVEDEKGSRYWIFRLGHYQQTGSPEWYLHGFFA
ncbi:MAG: nucleotidyltransferase [Cytophagaceae bacterium SCN 52-12]|nr:MAG: nucleotidyltransferase [Cytophagaceae bacterium SCN 52-12]